MAKNESPKNKPWSGPNPTLEDIIQLFEQFKKITLNSLLNDTNDRIPPIPGQPWAASNITAVANECRNRYLRDRTALIGAFGHLLEAESLIRQPLGWRTWDNLDVDNAVLRDEWKNKCVTHIDKIMKILEKVEEQTDECAYKGNWAEGWSCNGLFPRGKGFREIGRPERYSNDESIEG